MIKRAMNLFEFVFAVFFLLKITHQTNVSEWSWFWILLPLILNFINMLFRWVAVSLNLQEQWRKAVVDYYIDQQKKKFLKKELINERSKIK